MYIQPALLPVWLLLVLAALMLPWLLAALRFAPWGALQRAPRRVHLVAGGALACVVLWLMNVRGIDGLVLHLLGMTTLTLLLGWSLATLAGSLALLVVLLFLGLPLSGYAPAWLFSVALPASVSWGLGRLLYRQHLGNLFIYIFGAGFAGGALVIAVDAAVALLIFSLAGLGAWVERALELFPLLFLVMFSEAFINGMCVAALAVFYPSWMKTLDEGFYFGD
jgi:uncharacterized membrane protein